MSKPNWNRPVHKLYRREFESINGGLPSGVFSLPRPRPPRVSKEQLRAQGERAYADWLAKRRRELPKKKALCRKSLGQGHE